MAGLDEILKSSIPLDSNDYKVHKLEEVEENWKAELACRIKSEEEIKAFVSDYNHLTDETLKLKLNKPSTPKSIYEVRSIYRCYHDTRYQKTRDANALLSKNPSKHFQNTFCPFQIIFKVHKISQVLEI